MPDGRSRILIVEDQAHVERGHFPIMFSELARAIEEQGRDVTVLTAHGWARPAGTVTDSFEVLRLGRVLATIHRVAGLYNRIPGRFRHAAHAWQDIVMIVAARRVRHRLGGADVIVTSYGLAVYVTATIAGGGRWLLYQFTAPGAAGRMWQGRRRRRSPVASALARRLQRRRQRRGDVVRIALNSDQFRDQWNSTAPWLEPRRVPFTAVEPRQPTVDARTRLGLDHETRLALVFGGAHAGKDHDVVWQTFEHLADWRLMVAGNGASQAYTTWAAGRADPTDRPVVFDGFASEELRALLYSAPDLVVLSFRPGADFDSGTLSDAISWGLPVVCSDQCFAGDIVAQFDLGSLFVSGDQTSLAAAVHTAHGPPDAHALASARDAFSAKRMAEYHLRALGR
jgi:glycosyltransferase involved in cell wall biosynthesis